MASCQLRELPTGSASLRTTCRQNLYLQNIVDEVRTYRQHFINFRLPTREVRNEVISGRVHDPFVWIDGPLRARNGHKANPVEKLVMRDRICNDMLKSAAVRTILSYQGD